MNADAQQWLPLVGGAIAIAVLLLAAWRYVVVSLQRPDAADDDALDDPDRAASVRAALQQAERELEERPRVIERRRAGEPNINTWGQM